MSTELSKDVITHYAVTFTGVHYPLTFIRYQSIASAAPDDEFDLDGNLVKRKNIADLLTVEKYKESHPDKTPTNYNPIHKPLQSFEDIAEEFAWTGYPNMLELITKTHRRLREWKGSFEEFCIKHKALTPSGAVCTFKFTDKKGKKIDAVFAYPFFQAIQKLIEDRDSKKEYAEEKTWEELGKMAGQA